MICGMPKVTIDSSDAERLCRMIEQRQADLDRALARVAELEQQVQQFVCSGTGPLGVLLEKHDKARELRKQAEAVEKCEVELNQTPGAMLWDMDQVQSWLAEEVHRLRNQADELEKAGGEP